MERQLGSNAIPRAQIISERAVATFQRFLHVEAASGVVLLIAAAVALIWANSPFADSYHEFWHSPLSVGLGEFVIIAFFYSGGFEPIGFLIAALGVAMIIGPQRTGAGAACAYVIPGAILWIGLLLIGAHPALAGVVLGLMTLVRPMPLRESPVDGIWRIAGQLRNGVAIRATDAQRLQ
jgi:Na+/H+ antiporter NhaA